MDTNPVAAALATVSLGPEIAFENLTMLPLLRNHERSTSTSSTPSTSSTRSTDDYLVLDEELVGAKQNRDRSNGTFVLRKCRRSAQSCAEAAHASRIGRRIVDSGIRTRDSSCVSNPRSRGVRGVLSPGDIFHSQRGG